MGGYISDCYNKANITSTNVNGNYSSSDAGGISGWFGHINNCYNIGNISATGRVAMVGGITRRKWWLWCIY